MVIDINWAILSKISKLIEYQKVFMINDVLLQESLSNSNLSFITIIFLNTTLYSDLKSSFSEVSFDISLKN